MMVNINPVSAVRFRGTEANATSDFLSRPGSFSTPADNFTTTEPKKKKHGFLKVLGKIALTAAIATAAAVALHKFLPGVFKTTKTEGLTGFKKYAEYITTPIGKFGNYVSENCIALWNKIFKKAASSTASAAGTATGATAGAAGAATV